MEIATVVSVTQTLAAVLQNAELQEICSILGYNSKLDKRKKTVATIRDVFLDAEAKQEELDHEAQLWVEELKDAVYDADDLLDEFLILAEQNELTKGGKISEEVRLFFSRFDQLGFSMSFGVKKIRNKLDAIASNHIQFRWVDYKPIHSRRDRTLSFEFPEGIIGREVDTEKIVGMLLDSDVQRDVSFLTIVGVRGLGKTTLAQLVYDHGRVEKEFDYKLWVRFSGNKKQSDAIGILSNILKSATGWKSARGWWRDVTQLESLLQELLAGKKYLIVLDDLWTEEPHEWVRLLKAFVGGRIGSWIMATTRSREMARVFGNALVYELPGLSEHHSWCLFERLAFEEGKKRADSHLVEIGHEIVKTCANNPLALRVVGSLLYGQDEDQWLSFKEIGLFKTRHGENSVLLVLKYSYYHLESPIRSCFNYCALFPKGYEIEKDMLISLWIAQGYIVPLYEAQSLEDASEEYFSILLQRDFFQEVRRDEFGDVVSCKVHDLMHDIAQEVGGKEICAVDSITRGLVENVRHVSVCKSMFTGTYFTKTKIRTYLQMRRGQSHVETLLSNCTRLRAFKLQESDIKSLPSNIGMLLHLRYLNLSWNQNLEELPQSITELHNLQTLDLKSCFSLKELPKDLSKLVKLRTLDVEGCSRLTYMPWGMGKLSCLRKLTMFVVAEANSSRKQSVVDQLEDLETLTSLKDNLKIWIRIPKNVAYMKGDDREGGYLRNMQHLKHIDIAWERKESDGRCDYEEALLEDLQPHSNLRFLLLVDYHGVRMPSWAREDNLVTFLPNLVKIHLANCYGLQYLPLLRKLRHLKSLVLFGLRNLEYVEITNPSSYASESRAEELLFFPSLEDLQLSNLPMLKEWWGGMGVGDDQLVDSRKQPHLWPSFPRLCRLTIRGCPNLISVPLCSSLITLSLENSSESLTTMIMGKDHRERGESVATSSSLYHDEMKSVAHDPNTRVMEIFAKSREDNSVTFLPNLVKIRFASFYGLQYLPLLRKLCHLKSLILEGLRNLEYVEITSPSSYASESRAEELLFFPSLEDLRLSNLPMLKEWWGGMGVGDDQLVDSSNQPHLWPSFPRLCRLTIRECPNLISIPLCPSFVSLSLDESSERWRTIIMGKDHRERGESVATSSSLYHDEMKSVAHDPKSGLAEEMELLQSDVSETDSSESQSMQMSQDVEADPCRLIEPNMSISVSVNPGITTTSYAEVLSTVESWELFCSQVGNDIVHSPEIETYARAIVEKCHGLPLITSIVGSALSGESSVAEWELASRIFQFSDTYSVSPLTRYSYDRLKARDVKTCLLYCALFPRDREINVSILVECFVNERLLRGRTIAAYRRGHDIVRLLVNASLLEASDNGLMVKMHNVIRDSALDILSSDIEGYRLLTGSYSRTSLVQCVGESSSGTTSVDKYITSAGAQLKEPPALEEWEQADMIFLMDNELSSLPTKPNCPNLVALHLQRNNSLRVIPTTFFDGMCTLKILNLSSTRINSLPESLSILENLRVLLLRDCKRLLMLPSPIESLKLLEVLDLEGTELRDLPDFVGNLASLKQLRVSFHGSVNQSEYNKLPKKLISDGVISRLQLSELGLFVFPRDPRWISSAPRVAKEVSSLKLSSLCFPFPCAAHLETVVESQSWKNRDLTAFEFIIGHDFKRIVSRVSRDTQLMHREEERCLRFVNGEDIPGEVVEVLTRATSFCLDHHLTVICLSEFGLDKMKDLKMCIVRDCPEIREFININEHAGIFLPFLEYLSINYLWKLERFWVGPVENQSLERLRYLSLNACPKLSYVLSCSMLDILRSLEELVIENCESLEHIVIEDDVMVAGRSIALGSLKVLKLHYLPKLCGIWKGSWPHLEFISFYNCPKLKNLHMKADEVVNIQEIAAEKAWWDFLDWDDTVLRTRLHKCVTEICIDDL